MMNTAEYQRYLDFPLDDYDPDFDGGQCDDCGVTEHEQNGAWCGECGMCSAHCAKQEGCDDEDGR